MEDLKIGRFKNYEVGSHTFQIKNSKFPEGVIVTWTFFLLTQPIFSIFAI